MGQAAVQDGVDGAEVPFAKVQGEPWAKMPKDLYIPPDALEVFLDTFEGPLDLLLYLIRRQNLDILDIPILEITAQYMDYVELMREARLELAAEYLVMAAMLAEIKSRMLLPRPAEALDDELDPRAELVRRLQEYERFKQAAMDLDALPRLERDQQLVAIDPGQREHKRPEPDVDLKELLIAFAEVMARAQHFGHHQIARESLSMRERMSRILELVCAQDYLDFSRCFDLDEGRPGVVVSFMAILELLKEGLIELVQTSAFAPIHLRAAGGTDG